MKTNKLGIGVDIERISRFKPRLKDKNFLSKIFTAKELKYCFSKAIPEHHLAGRYAAKEAVFKALSQAGLNLKSLKNIEIIPSKAAPGVRVSNLKPLCSEILVSIAHSNESAIAFALVML